MMESGGLNEGGPGYSHDRATCLSTVKLVETDGKRGRYREITVDSGAGESVVESRRLAER